MDLLAPTVWHALCLLMLFFVQARARDCTFSDPANLDKFFGTQVLYRGQARGWNIVPSAWRSAGQIRANEKRLAALHTFWKEWCSPEHDPSFELFGRLDDLRAAEAVAQHYGLPTNLIDFTFDPRIALWFACDECRTESVPDLSESLRNHAVIYFTSFYKLVSVGKYAIHLPHPSASRVYRQSGCFLDYGEKPESVPTVLDFRESWMWAQENCYRLFFPRSYPNDFSLNEISSDWIYASEEFFEQSVKLVMRLDGSQLLDPKAAADALRLGVQAKPQWRRSDELRTNFVYTDEEFWQLVRPVERFLRVAALVETRDGSKIDPWILVGLARTNADPARALEQVATLPYGHLAGVAWIAERIKESKKLFSEYLRNAG